MLEDDSGGAASSAPLHRLLGVVELNCTAGSGRSQLLLSAVDKGHE